MIHFNVGDMPSCRHCKCVPLWSSSQVTGQFEFVTFVFNSMLFNSMTVVGEISPAIQNYRIDLTFVNHVLFIVHFTHISKDTDGDQCIHTNDSGVYYIGIDNVM